MKSATKPCNDTGCDRPRHITKSGVVCSLCKMHQSLYERGRRLAGCETEEQKQAKREAARLRSAASYRARKAAGTLVKPVVVKPEFHCERCRDTMPNARYDVCAKCRRDDDIARAQRKIDARLAREALRREKLEALAAAKAKSKVIDYASSNNLAKYLCCKECGKYELRSVGVAKHYCSEKCKVNNNKRYRRELPSDSMRI